MLATPAAAQTPAKVNLPANARTLTPLKTLKAQRFAKLPRKSTLPPLSTIRPQALSSTASRTTISRQKIATKKTASEPVNEDAAGRYCTTRNVSEASGEYSKIVLGNQSDKIYPGAIYADTAFLSGTYNPPANLQRRPYEIATSLFSAASTGPSYVQVQPSLGGVNDGVAQLMRNNSNVVNAANVAVEVSQIYSIEQLAFELQAGYQGYGVDLQAEFAYSKDSQKRVILAKLTQTYFSVMLNRPEGSLLVENAAALPANTLYVNKVNYGRLGLLKIETSYSAEEIKAALDFRYAQGNQSANVNADLAYKKVLEDIKIDGFFFGGDATNGMVSVTCTRETCAAKLEEFNSYVRNGLRLNTMVAPTPISYELKYLNDNATAAVNSTTSYVERNCQSARGVAVTLAGISIQDVHKAWNGEPCDTATCNSDCGYAWGSVKVEVEERKNGVRVKTVPAILNGKPARTTTLWERTQRAPQRGIMNFKALADSGVPPINNVNRSFVYQLDPRVYAEGRYFLKVTTDIKTNHKDNHIATLGFHGMKRAVVRDVPLANALFDQSKSTTEHKHGSWIAGPFSSESNRLHHFRAHFKVTPE